MHLYFLSKNPQYQVIYQIVLLVDPPQYCQIYQPVENYEYCRIFNFSLDHKTRQDIHLKQASLLAYLLNGCPHLLTGHPHLLTGWPHVPHFPQLLWTPKLMTIITKSEHI